MVQKHFVLSMIAPVAVAGILIMAILAATVKAQESNSTENAQESNNTGNATSTGVPENTTSTGMAENATSPSQSMENTTSGMESNNTGNAQESNSNMTATAPNIGNSRQQSNNTGNATSPSGSTENNGTGTTPVNNGTGTTPVNNGTGTTPVNNGTGTPVDANSVLAVHNSERAAVGVPPLVWSDKLAADAKLWAETLAAGKNCCGPHEAQFKEGENIVTSPGNVTTAEMMTMMHSWAAEKPILHYLQVVSNTSKSVGCAIAKSTVGGESRGIWTGKLWSYLVCRYSPPCGPECGAPAYVRAIEYFDKVLATDPQDVRALTGKAASLNALGNHTGATEYCDKAKAIKSYYTSNRLPC